MSRIHPNNFKTTLASSCSNVATSITLTDNLPTIAAGEYIVITVTDNINYELFKIDSNTGAPTYNIVTRALESTTARSWSSGAQVSIRVTKESIDGKQDLIDNVTPSTVTLVAGDAILIKDASDSNKLKQALASDITALNPWEKIGSATASASSTITFTGLGTYAKIMFVINDLLVSTEGIGVYGSLNIQTSSNNGSSYDSGASDYGWVSSRGTSGGAGGNPDANNPTTFIAVVSNAANYAPDKDTGGGMHGEINLWNTAGTSSYKTFTWQIGYLQNQGFPAYAMGTGMRRSTSAVNAVKFYLSNGNFVSGTITVYGLKF